MIYLYATLLILLNTAFWASILVGMQIDKLPLDYIETRNDRVEAVTLEDVARVAKRLYRPDALRFVIVGQPDGVDNVN